MVGAAEFYALAADLVGASGKIVVPLRTAFDTAGKTTATAWASVAAGTAGAHGVHYPSSIDHEVKLGFGGVEVEVGPNAGKTQGGMGRGFEFGSMNQAPHLDGVGPFEATAASLGTLAGAAVETVIP